MPRAYNENLKQRIIYLLYDGYSKKQIEELLYVSTSLINKVFRLYKKWGTVVNPWRQIPERHKTFNRDDMNVCINFIYTIYFYIQLYFL